MQKVVPQSGTETELIPAIGYIRVSTYLEEKISPELQRTAILDWATRNRRTIVNWIEDLDATGRNFKRRIMQGIEAVEQGHAAEIAVWKFSRFGRTRHGNAVNIARLHAVGGELQSATEDVDAKTATGRFARGMLLEVAAFESDRTAEQWRETHEWRRANGLPASGGRRFGYIWTPRRVPNPDRPGEWILQDECYAPDPETGPVLADLYARHIAGEGFYTLAGWLNDSGHLNTRGRRWGQNGLLRYMDSGFAAGLLFVHRDDVRCGSPAQCQLWRDHYRHLPADHPGVIDDDTWQAYLTHRARIQALPPRARNATYPLTGMVRCGRCQGPAVISGKVGKRGYSYRCSGQSTRRTECPGIWMRRSVVEDEVYAWLLRLASDLDARTLGTVVEPAPPPVVDTSALRARLTRKAGKLSTALDKAARAYAMGDIPRDTYLRTRDDLTADLEHAQKELAELAEQAAADPGPETHREVVEGLVSDWRVITPQTKRDLLSTLVRYVTVGPEGVHVWPVWEPAA